LIVTGRNLRYDCAKGEFPIKWSGGNLRISPVGISKREKAPVARPSGHSWTQCQNAIEKRSGGI
jgi:hypothetical protein